MKGSFRTIILALILVPAIAFLINFAVKKNAESEQRAQQCHEQCGKDGFAGSEFKWNILSGPVCRCL